MTKVKELAEDHWKYTEEVVKKSLEISKLSKIQKEIIMILCEFLYIAAFCHGWKHKEED
jgi:hypothetical protein